jgi:serine protease
VRKSFVAALAGLALVLSAVTPATASVDTLVYRGGPVQVTPAVYLVFWGAEWTVEGDPAGEAAYLQHFYQGLYGSGDTWSGTTRQYCQGAPYGATSCPSGAQFVGGPSGSLLKGVWYDIAEPSDPEGGETTIGQEAIDAAVHFGNTTPQSNKNAQYVIATASKRWAPGTGVLYCSWHASVSSPYGEIAYTYLPYLSDWAATCGGNAVNSGSSGTLDGVGIAAGAQYAATITDPVPTTGWTGAGEIAEECGAQAYDITLSTGRFAVPALWSNAANGCV